jgi:hypothetical protein
MYNKLPDTLYTLRKLVAPLGWPKHVRAETINRILCCKLVLKSVCNVVVWKMINITNLELCITEP